MNVLVIETHTDEGVEWGISFTDYNPAPEDYLKMADKETAFRLRDKLAELAPTSGNKPVTVPSDEL
jgi:hypothetical protein